ncbi:hypothetical protein BPAE_0657g00030 [Botrytis paeoniae]|uniref:Uncharacterized protein n=1 Tax=Botrytis paeoniae TaxID=278948 RepID=A0A4Z1ESG3_9HELO|nr:hypothetical protein BPAE_0657g00030 [Botrytis paeoniae]
MDLVSRRIIEQAVLQRIEDFCYSLLTGTHESLFHSSTARLTGNSRVTRYGPFHHEPVRVEILSSIGA